MTAVFICVDGENLIAAAKEDLIAGDECHGGAFAWFWTSERSIIPYDMPAADEFDPLVKVAFKKLLCLVFNHHKELHVKGRTEESVSAFSLSMRTRSKPTETPQQSGNFGPKIERKASSRV